MGGDKQFSRDHVRINDRSLPSGGDAPPFKRQVNRHDLQPENLHLSQMDASVVSALPPGLREELERAAVASSAEGGEKEADGTTELDRMKHGKAAAAGELGKMSSSSSDDDDDDDNDDVCGGGKMENMPPRRPNEVDPSAMMMMPTTLSQIDRVELPEDIRQEQLQLVHRNRNSDGSPGRRRHPMYNNPEQEHIATLVSFGFTEEEARDALRACEGSPDRAADSLFRKKSACSHNVPDSTTAGTSSSSSQEKKTERRRRRIVPTKECAVVDCVNDSCDDAIVTTRREEGATSCAAKRAGESDILLSWKEFMQHIQRFDANGPIDTKARHFLLEWMKLISRPQLGDLQQLLDVATFFLDSYQLDQLVIFLRFILRHARSPILNKREGSNPLRSKAGIGRWEKSGIMLLEYVQDAVHTKHGFTLQQI